MRRVTLLLVPLLLFACDRAPVAPSGDDGPGPALASTVASPGGSALAFDGVDDYVRVPDAPSLDMTDGLTIAAWIYLDEYTEWASFVTKGGEGDHNNYTVHQSGTTCGICTIKEKGHLRFTGDPNSSTAPPESNTQIPTDAWHYVAVTFDGTALRFYYDGEPDGSATLGPLTPNDEPLHIGVDFPGGDEYWHGRIDEVRIWNQALSATQLQAAMHGHAVPLSSALVGHWQFDEGSGATVRDYSPERNDGQLVNGPTWVTPGAPIGNAGW